MTVILLTPLYEFADLWVDDGRCANTLLQLQAMLEILEIVFHLDPMKFMI
jgi:hypothetical protein